MTTGPGTRRHRSRAGPAARWSRSRPPRPLHARTGFMAARAGVVQRGRRHRPRPRRAARRSGSWASRDRQDHRRPAPSCGCSIPRRARSSSTASRSRTLKGEPLRKLRQRFQMIFQDPYSSLNPRMTVGGDRRRAARHPQASGASSDRQAPGPGAAGDRRASAARPRAGTRTSSAAASASASGSRERSRSNPDLVVADEPISALDVSIRAQILNLLERLQARFRAVLPRGRARPRGGSPHQRPRRGDVPRADRRGRRRPPSSTEAPLHPYTVALLSAVPIPDPAVQQHRRRIILRGDIPSPVNPPSGCRFHTRCWLFERLGRPEECTTVDPTLREAASAHRVACHFAERLDGSIEQRQATGRPVPAGAPAAAPAAAAASAGTIVPAAAANESALPSDLIRGYDLAARSARDARSRTRGRQT